jgi:hypothetical protein
MPKFAIKCLNRRGDPPFHDVSMDGGPLELGGSETLLKETMGVNLLAMLA